MPASFEVLDRTRSGKAKVRYSGIEATGYRDLESGEPIKQQSFAAAKGNEQSQYERDENGRITGREVPREDESTDERPEAEAKEIVGDDFEVHYRSQRMHTDRSPTGSTPLESDEWEVRLWKYGDEPMAVDEGRMDDHMDTVADAIENDIGRALADEIRRSSPDGEEDREMVDPDESIMLGRPYAYVKIDKYEKTYCYEVQFRSKSLERVDSLVDGPGKP